MSDNLTLASLFRLDPDRLSQDAVAVLRSAEGMRDLPRLFRLRDNDAVWTKSTSCLARALHGALDIPVEEILTHGWNSLRELRRYADPEEHSPIETIEHVLYEHTIRSTHHPGVELLFDGVAIGHVVFDAVLEAKLETATLVIRAGRILEVQPGTCRFTGELKYRTALLGRLSSEEFRFPGAIHIPGGLPITAAAAAPAGA